jgi:ABC-2 type transport system permease protein
MWLRVSALLLRYLYLYRRSLPRAMELFFWPVMELLIWGFLTVYLSRVALPSGVVYLIGAAILWEVFYRSQMAITLSISEEIWVRNIINLFIAPVRVPELLLSTCLLGLIRSALTAAVLGVLAQLLYAFDLLSVGAALIPFYASLLLFGWAVGMCTVAVILRFGQAAEALVWGVPFLVQPLSAVFYPVGILPGWLQAVARLLPSTYVFEGMREALRTGGVDASLLGKAFTLNLVYLVGASVFFGWMLTRVREKGYLSRLAME